MMSRILFFGLFILFINISFAQQFGSFTDSRDGKQYKTVKIGNQVWMAENLNANKFQNGDIIGNAGLQKSISPDNFMDKPGWCYFDYNPKYSKNYGKLYNFEVIADKRQIAPLGWHIPTVKEWEILIDFLGGKDIAGGKLKNTITWRNLNNSSNSSGFSANAGGELSSTPDFIFGNESWGATFWCMASDKLEAIKIGLDTNSKNVNFQDTDPWGWFSIRCIKD